MFVMRSLRFSSFLPSKTVILCSTSFRDLLVMTKYALGISRKCSDLSDMYFLNGQYPIFNMG